jgi:PhzF family phenazine biosynthesis protein
MKIYQVDAFTARPFAGNPAAVCVLDAAGTPDEAWMQAVAAEMNLAETAFAAPRPDGTYGLRWFTPTTEVPLCGHATLATAHVLWRHAGATDAVLRFHTLSGELTAQREQERIVLDFPAAEAGENLVREPAEAALADLAVRALGAAPSWQGRTDFFYLFALADEQTVRGLRPDLAALGTLAGRAVIVTAAAADPAAGYAIVSRVFAPALGIPEDPVTGSAHCVLAPFWAPRLGRPEFTAYQASARGGFVGVHLAGTRVRLTGDAVTVLEGTLAA